MTLMIFDKIFGKLLLAFDVKYRCSKKKKKKDILNVCVFCQISVDWNFLERLSINSMNLKSENEQHEFFLCSFGSQILVAESFPILYSNLGQLSSKSYAFAKKTVDDQLIYVLVVNRAKKYTLSTIQPSLKANYFEFDKALQSES